MEKAEGRRDGTVDPAVEGLGGHGEGLQVGRRRRGVGEGMVGAGEALVHLGQVGFLRHGCPENGVDIGGRLAKAWDKWICRLGYRHGREGWGRIKHHVQ